MPGLVLNGVGRKRRLCGSLWHMYASESQLVAMCLLVSPSFFKRCAGRMLSCWCGRMQVWQFLVARSGWCWMFRFSGFVSREVSCFC